MELLIAIVIIAALYGLVMYGARIARKIAVLPAGENAPSEHRHQERSDIPRLDC